MTRLSRTPGSDHSAADAAFRADADHLAQVVDEVIAARVDSGPNAADAGDLLGLMLTAEHPADGTTLDTANIRNQVITFLIAGHETTSGAMSFALYYLAKHPAVLQLVQREADALWGDAADPEPTFEEIGQLTYTRQVLNEALRLWPTAAAFSRRRPGGHPARRPDPAARRTGGHRARPDAAPAAGVGRQPRAVRPRALHGGGGGRALPARVQALRNR